MTLLRRVQMDEEQQKMLSLAREGKAGFLSRSRCPRRQAFFSRHRHCVCVPRKYILTLPLPMLLLQFSENAYTNQTDMMITADDFKQTVLQW